MRLANNLYKVELKKSEEAVTGKIGLGWMVDSLRHFGQVSNRGVFRI